MYNNYKFINVDIESNFTLRFKITRIPFRINIDNLFILPVLGCEVAHCKLAPLLIPLSNFLKLISHGRYER